MIIPDENKDLYKLLSWAVWKYFEEGGETNCYTCQWLIQGVFHGMLNRDYLECTQEAEGIEQYNDFWKYNFYKKNTKQNRKTDEKEK